MLNVVNFIEDDHARAGRGQGAPQNRLRRQLGIVHIGDMRGFHDGRPQRPNRGVCGHLDKEHRSYRPLRLRVGVFRVGALDLA